MTFSRLQCHTLVRLTLNEYVCCLNVRMINLKCFADCLNMLDETTTPGSAVASDAYCNRALVLMRQRPPDNEAALQDSSCAIACNGANCKARNGHVIQHRQCMCLTWAVFIILSPLLQ